MPIDNSLIPISESYYDLVNESAKPEDIMLELILKGKSNLDLDCFKDMITEIEDVDLFCLFLEKLSERGEKDDSEILRNLGYNINEKMINEVLVLGDIETQFDRNITFSWKSIAI